MHTIPAGQPHRSFPNRDHWVEDALIVGVLLLMAGLLGWGLVEVSRDRNLRCYALDSKHSQSAKLTLKSQGLVCVSNRCRVVLHYLHQSGLACYFSTEAANESRPVFSANERTPFASQRSFALPGYRTT